MLVGRRLARPTNDLLATYEDRLHKRVDWQLLSPSKKTTPDAIRSDESSRLLKMIGQDSFVVLLDERGTMPDSVAFAKLTSTWFEQPKQLVFVIGGAFGVDEGMRQAVDYVWSLSPLVFPHELTRILLVEQLYRAQSINDGHSYHHA